MIFALGNGNPPERKVGDHKYYRPNIAEENFSSLFAIIYVLIIIIIMPAAANKVIPILYYSVPGDRSIWCWCVPRYPAEGYDSQRHLTRGVHRGE